MKLLSTATFIAHRLFASLLLVAAAACGCAEQTGEQSSEIIGGDRATRSQFPSIVAFGAFEDAGKAMTCTATRVAESTFLTAAHCLLDPELGTLRAEFAPEQWVTFYKGDEVSALYEDMADLQVESIAIVPNREIDVALIATTALSADDSGDVAIASVATAAEARVAPGDVMALAGYGRTSVANDDGPRPSRPFPPSLNLPLSTATDSDMIPAQ
jgi:V8-like Glu-specific endopeptidase